MIEILSQYWATILVVSSGFIVILTVIEKIFDKEFIGRPIFRLFGRIVRFFINVDRIKETILIGFHTGKKMDLMIAESQARDVRLDGVIESLRVITSEFRTNGGNSIKDDVNRLLASDEEKLGLLHDLRDNVSLNTLRISIIDNDAGRMTFMMDPNLELIQISATFLRFFGYADEDMLGKDWDFCLGERTKQNVLDKWDKAVKREQDYKNQQYILDSDGKEFYCVVHGYPRFVDKEFIGFYGTVEVVPDRPESVPVHIEGEINVSSGVPKLKEN